MAFPDVRRENPDGDGGCCGWLSGFTVLRAPVEPKLGSVEIDAVAVEKNQVSRGHLEPAVQGGRSLVDFDHVVDVRDLVDVVEQRKGGGEEEDPDDRRGHDDGNHPSIRQGDGAPERTNRRPNRYGSSS